MQLMNGVKIVFETQEDLVNYLTLGFVPTKKDFERVMEKITNPNSDDETPDTCGDRIFLPERALMDCDRATMDKVLRQVYANRVRNRNVMLAAAGIVGGLLIISTIRGGCKKKNKDDVDCHSLSSEDIMANAPRAEIGNF